MKDSPSQHAAFFDESGIHGEAYVAAVGGLVAPAATWQAIEAPWRKLQAELGIEHFHMVECANATGQFAGRRDRPEIRRYAAHEFAQILAEAGLRDRETMGGFWVGVVVDDWKAMSDSDFLERYRTPYHFCLENCLQRIAAWSRQRVAGAAVDLVFSEQTAYQRRAEEVFQAYQGAPAWAPLKSMTYSPMKNVVPLQAADMVATAMNKRAEFQEYGSPPDLDAEAIYEEVANVLAYPVQVMLGGWYDQQALEFAVRKYRENMAKPAA